ncbi:uncharacterized protein LOC111401781 [Olea europaea var. sylvestris]|uniref:Protein POLAR LOCALIZATION DURING ASYMMETRIC DIVISION AND REDISTRIBUTION n=1 Tax=Olea europaea subsp. europaea TaxID=158383 RepID=A0A8S0RWL6_OLEEU|nr:uncharacterized protein LOC111401781 [Olea europaea var. sylvestris]XP_022885452.1 uncharacterized protein LOC111401781 [Olea europaea var. sylvestris]CAA2983744.1 Hypothetical predicted protein [Olea europaea subsp. europaea]
MDVWVVAAAAGAGYLAQHLKNLSLGKHYSSDLSSANANFDRSEPVEDKHCSFRSVLGKNKLVKDGCREDTKVSQEASAAEMASTSGFGGENTVELENLMICSPNSNLLPVVLNNEDVLEDWEGRGQNIDEVHSDLSCQLSAREMSFSYGVERKRSRLRTRRTNRRFIKPLTSLESCLLAQLYKEHSEIEEYTFSSTHSPRKPTVRPFVVTDGSRIISRACHESFNSSTGTGKYNLHKSTYSQDGEVVLGIPGLPKFALMKCRNKAKTGKEKVARSSNSSRMVKGNTNNSPEGSSGGALNFYLGLSVGIISSFLAHKGEIEKLNTLLRQTENLVQDLQEELEMKDLLTMKELSVENHESQDIHNDYYYKEAVNALSPEQKVDNSTEYCREEYGDQNVKEISLSNIESELEAELKRLELNMSSSKLEKKISKLAEVDKDFIADVVEGELRGDLFDKPYVDQDENGCSTPCSINHAVSPRELSLRLHEVIQSQLEERVKELETALQNSQRKMKYAESKNAPCWSEFSNNGAGSYEEASTDEPAIINLSGEALAAYNEAYDEFVKVTESDEEDTPSGLEDGNEQEIFQDGQQVHNGSSNHYTRHSFVNGSPPLLPNHRKDIVYSTDENEDDEEEIERMLIRQIVEKARKGSPVILNAQRALLSTDEYQH